MSYCRYGNDSDVYIYASAADTCDLWQIHIDRDESYTVWSLEALKDKCNFLRKAGYKIPQRVFERIEREMTDGTS